MDCIVRKYLCKTPCNGRCPVAICIVPGYIPDLSKLFSQRPDPQPPLVPRMRLKVIPVPATVFIITINLPRTTRCCYYSLTVIRKFFIREYHLAIVAANLSTHSRFPA